MHYLCHYCNKSAFHQFYVTCCKKKCSKIFCLNCILLKFDKDFKLENVRPETWICYACGQKCDCIHCDPKGLKREGGSSKSQIASKLRVSGKIKWYHEKNRGALKTVSYDCRNELELKLQENKSLLNSEKEEDKESCGSFEKEIKLEKRKQKRDLSKLENKYLNKKKALRECTQEDIIQNLVENHNEKIAKLLTSIDLDGTEVEILDAESELL